MMRLVLMFILLITMPIVLRADAGVHYMDIALSGSGKPIAHAPMRVCWELVTQTNPCLPLATIYEDVTLTTVKPNPFSADALGNIDFYYDSSSGMRATIEVSCQPSIPGCGPQGSVSITRSICIFCGETMQVGGTTVATQPIFNFIEGSNVQISGANDPTANRANLTISALPGGNLDHNWLSETHPDTVPYSPPEIGDLARGNAFRLWERFPVGQEGQVLTTVAVGGILLPDWVFPGTLDTCTSIQVSGIESGCEHEINFIPGTNITSIVAVDDSDNNRTNVTINAAAGGGGLSCVIDQLTDYYVDPAGDDGTGDGTPGNPWKTIMTAVNQIPGLVCGKYTIHLAHGTYTQVYPNPDYLGVHIDGRAFAGGGVGGWNAGAPPGGTYWPWESAWIEIVGDPTPGLEFTGGDGDSIDSYILDHAGACDGNAAISISGGNLVLRGLSVRNAGFGLLAHSSKVKVAGVSFQHNCTDIDAGYSSLIYHDKEDLDTGSWCGDTFCWYAQFRKQAQLFKNWAILLHDFSLQSDETADDNGDTASSTGLDFTCTGACGTGADVVPRSLFEKSARLSIMGRWNADSSALTGGLGQTLIQFESIFNVGVLLLDNAGNTACGVPPCGGALLFAQDASIIHVVGSDNIKNAAKGVELWTGSKLLYQPTFTNVTTPTVSGTASYLSVN